MPRFPRLRHFVDHLLHTHDSPRRTAGAFALGVFLGFSPLLGLHTLLGLLFAFIFGLNRLAVLIGVYSNLPWIMPAYYVMATAVGATLLGVSVPPELFGRLREVVRGPALAELRLAAQGLAPLFWSFMVGSTLGAAVLSFLSYHAALSMIVARRRHRETHSKH